MSVADSTLDLLRTRFPDVEFVGADDAETLAREAVDADVFYGWRFPRELVPRAPRLRWIQSASAGVEDNLSPEVRARGIVLTNGAGIAAVGIAEHVVGQMLYFCRNHHVAARLQQEGRWDRPRVIGGDGVPIRDFAGSRVAVLGLGPIGVAVTERSAALGAVVRGMRRRAPAAAAAPYEAVVGPDQLDSLLGWADFVVVALPHTPETTGLLGARQLARMRSDAYVVNVARGAVFDEGALIGALEGRAIAGAALDVFQVEPLPESSRLWHLPNVLVTPHVAGATPRYLERALALFVDNMERFLRGDRLRNVVDHTLGYPSGS